MIDHGYSQPPASNYSEQELAEFNRRHDEVYEFDPRLCGIYGRYSRCSDGRVIGCPGLNKTWPNEILDDMVWAWHNGDYNETYLSSSSDL